MLKLLLIPFRILFKALGVNEKQLHAILKVKLTMDNRRNMSFSNSNKTPKNQILTQIFLYGVFGLMFLFIMIAIPSALLGYTIFFAGIMITIAFAMISEFTVLLFDARDNSILASRPVNNETLATAKIFHIAIYMLRISLSMSLAIVIYTLIKFGITATLLLLGLLIFTSFFVLFLTNIFYFALSNLVNAQRMKDIVVYMQVAMAILFMAGYQLMPRMLDYYDMEQVGDMVLQWWHLLIPPVWMSASLDMLMQGNYDLQHLLFLLFAIIVPILSLVLVVKVLSPRFNQAVQHDEKIQKVKKRTEVNQSKSTWMAWLTRIFTSNKQEAACFEMVWKMSGRERKYKQSVYPMFGYLVIFIAIYSFKGTDISLESLQSSKRYLIYLYFPILLLFSLVTSLSASESTKSSWFFRAMPISSVGIVLRGALKAVLLKYFVPTFVVITAFVLYVWGVPILDDVFLALVFNILIAILLQRGLVHDLPFTTEKNANDMSENFLKVIALLISLGIAIAIHYGLTYLDYAVSFAMLPLLILLWFLLKDYRKMKWSRIYS